MSDDDYRTPAKQWRRRNSDMIDTFEGERTAPTASIELDEYALPMTADERIANPDDPEGVAIRHTHVWGVEEA